MQKFFNHILVPVNFDKTTPMVMEKAVQVANYFNCDLHLLNVHTPVMAMPFVYDGHEAGAIYQDTKEKSERKMCELIATWRSKLHVGLLIHSAIMNGSWTVIIKEQVISTHADLVIMASEAKKILGSALTNVDTDYISQQTKCPVLNVTQEFNVAHLHRIIVPVDDFLPIRKLTLATYIAKKLGGVIHLVGTDKRTADGINRNAHYLTRAYQLLKDHTHVKVFSSPALDNKMSDEDLSFEDQRWADLIVVNPGRESRLQGVFKNWIGKYLYKRSPIPVLTIAPPV